ncbi:hypothetical protein NDU88_005864 [Pleurodeles waltl]|uniref:Uncharacterized protein n=1 Tax=Pleurodeles waltl TaxID=8319 RepID=A0AAV7L5B6_PLEWA|nr:hypothetical protein NDU88_005864 [Pleurodeles waltl]
MEPARRALHTCRTRGCVERVPAQARAWTAQFGLNRSSVLIGPLALRRSHLIFENAQLAALRVRGVTCTVSTPWHRLRTVRNLHVTLGHIQCRSEDVVTCNMRAKKENT